MRESTLAILLLSLGCLLSINQALAKPADGDDEGEEGDDDGEGEEGGDDGDCPDEWTSIAGGCYKFLPRNITGSSKKYNWEDAKEACHMLHGWLVEIESEEQNDAIHDEAQKQGFKNAWIGLTDEAEEGEWVWSSGKASSFTNWSPGSPSNTKQKVNKWQGEDCALMNIEHGGPKKPWSTPKKWNDASCPANLNVICQYKKGGFTRTEVCENK